MTKDVEHPGLGKNLTMGYRGELVPKQRSDRVVAAIVGVYSGSASEAAQISDSGHSVTADLPKHAKSPWRSLTALQEWQRQREVISCKSQRGLTSKATSGQSH